MTPLLLKSVKQIERRKKLMNKFLNIFAWAILVFGSQSISNAANYLTIDFSSGSYSNGQLIPGSSTAAGAAGQDGWAQLGTTSTSPIQISSGYAVLGPTGQDVYHGFTGRLIPTLRSPPAREMN